MKEQVRFAFDLGTNSIGWAVWSLGPVIEGMKTHELKELKDAGSRIFSDGRDSKSQSSLAVGRREARGMRRQRRRLNRRKLNLLRELKAQGLMPQDPAEARKMAKKDPYELRFRAVQERLEPYELGRIIYHLGQRRGYKSNALARPVGEEEEKEKQKEDGKNKSRISELEALFKKCQEAQTLGQFLHLRHEKRLEVRFRSPEEDPEKKQNGGEEAKKTKGRAKSLFHRDICAFYPTREMYVQEFEVICQQQAPYYEHLDWEALKQILFYQRPLKEQPRGHCWYYEDQERAYKAQISSNRYRILQKLLILRCTDEDGTEISLSDAEIETLYQELCRTKELSFKQIRKLLSWPNNRTFNLEKTRKTLKGSPVEADMAKPEYFGEEWNRLDMAEQDEQIERMMKLVFCKDMEPAREEFLELGLSEKQAENLCSYALPKGTTSMSAILQREVLGSLSKEKPKDGGAKLLREYSEGKSEIAEGSLERLPYYGQAMPATCYAVKETQQLNPDEREYGRIGNPTVHVALNQLRKVVNSLVDSYGKPTEIVLELGRDLKNSKKKRQEISTQQKKNETENNRRNEKLKNAGFTYPNREHRRKLALYEQLCWGQISAHCPYCGKTITRTELFSSDDKVEIEHILPYSRTLDSSMANLTVAHTRCNRFKGNRSPYEAFVQDTERWQKIQSVIKTLPKNKLGRFTENAIQRFEKDNAFLARQLTDNAYISRTAIRYLKRLCPQVWANNGTVTELLRDSWGLDSLLHDNEQKKGKNRDDHRHHALDAIVIGMVDRSLLLKITKLHTRNQQSPWEQQREAKKALAGERPGLRDKIEGVLKEIKVSHKPDHNNNSKMFDETAYGKIYKAIAVENGKELREQWPWLVSRKRQAAFVLNFLRAQVPQLVGKKAGHQDYEQLLQRLEGLAGYYHPKSKNVPSSQDNELLEKAHTLLKPKLWNEALQAYLLEHEDKLRYWKPFFVTSKALKGLEEKNCKPFDERTTGPVNETLRAKLREAWQQAQEASEKPTWKNFLADYGRKHNIRRLRYIPKDQTQLQPKKGSPQHYTPNGCASCVVWRIPKKKEGEYEYQSDFISYVDALNGRKSLRPHPAAKNMATLYKKDVLYSEEDQQYYLIKGFFTKVNRLDIRLLHEAQKGQNSQSIHVIFGERKCRPVRLDALGRQFC